MKNPLQNLLVFFSICLCLLMVVQWHVETGLRKDIQAREDREHDLKENIQSLQGSLKERGDEITRLDGLKKQLTEIVNSNRVEIAQLTKDLDKANQDIDKHLRTIDSYKAAVDRANENVKTANERITEQNAEMKKLADDRNEIVAKYNDVVKKFNDLAKQWNDMQAAATNAPAKK